jgi:hypothetical protein
LWPFKFPVERVFSEKRQPKLVHRGKSWIENAVNNSRGQDKGIVDFIGGFALFTGFPQARFGEQRVHINSLSVG